jgi:hypothetical protein
MATKAAGKKGAANGHRSPTLRQIEMVEVDKLKFDPENPRLPTTLKGKGEVEIIKWMLRETGIIELMGSIAEKGYFPGEPMLVAPGTPKGYFYVVEGNRRLCAVKLLNDPSSAPIRKAAINNVSKGAHKPDRVPVVKYDNRNQILEYLGYRHITGIKQWDPLAKAKYLKQLSKSLGKAKPEEQFKALAKGIGSSTNYVSKLLTGLALYERIAKEDFFDINDLSEDSIDFSLLTTALSWKDIVGYLGLSGQDPSLKGLRLPELKDLTEWLFKEENGSTRLVESRNLRALSAIIKSPRALDQFKNGTPILDAEVLAGVPVEVFRKAVHGARKLLYDAHETLPKVDNVTGADSETLAEVLSVTDGLKAVVDTRLKAAAAR